MMPKISPGKMKRMMRQMGMDMKELPATQVIIKLPDSEIVIENPNVSVVTAMGQKTYQITGTEKEKQKIPQEDIKLVAEQAKVSEEKAMEALVKTGGNLAEAILQLEGQK